MAFGFLSDGNFTLSVGGEEYDTTPLFILLGIIFVLGLVVLVYRGMAKKGK